MAKFRIEVVGDVRVIIDDQPDVRESRDGQNLFGQPADFVRRGCFGAELDQIRAAVAELLRDEFRRATLQIGRVHKRIKPAVRERFHGNNLTAKHAKYTKELVGFIEQVSWADVFPE
jgi:hypothetical protein